MLFIQTRCSPRTPWLCRGPLSRGRLRLLDAGIMQVQVQMVATKFVSLSGPFEVLDGHKGCRDPERPGAVLRAKPVSHEVAAGGIPACEIPRTHIPDDASQRSRSLAGAFPELDAQRLERSSSRAPYFGIYRVP